MCLGNSECTLYSQVFERVKEALSHEPQATKAKPLLASLEPATEYPLDISSSRDSHLIPVSDSTSVLPSNPIQEISLNHNPPSSIITNTTIQSPDPPPANDQHRQSGSSLHTSENDLCRDKKCHSSCTPFRNNVQVAKDRKAKGKTDESVLIIDTPKPKKIKKGKKKENVLSDVDVDEDNDQILASKLADLSNVGTQNSSRRVQLKMGPSIGKLINLKKKESEMVKFEQS